MAVLKFTALGGIEPSVLPRNLNPAGAQTALNLNPGTPEFRPLLTDVAVATVTVSNPPSLYRFDRNPDGTLNTNEAAGWKATVLHVDIVRQQIDDDVSGKIYYTPSNGSTPMRWHNAAGVDRQVGVPRPTAAPTIGTIDKAYIFTEEQRNSELRLALSTAVRSTLDNITPSWVGPTLPLPQGWLRTIDVLSPSDPQYNAKRSEVLRVFAVDATSQRVLATFSTMPPDEANWIFDPTLRGSYYTRQPGHTLPTWAGSYARFYIIPVQGFAQVSDLNSAGAKTALLALKKPGTQGAQPMLTSTQADEIVARVADHIDKDQPAVKSKLEALRFRINAVSDRFTLGGRSSLVAQTAAFYAKPEVVDAQAAARLHFANTMWQYIDQIARTRAVNLNDTGSAGGA